MTIEEFLTARLDEREQSARFTIELTERAYPADEFDVRWKWARLTEHKTSGGGGQSFEPGAPTPTEVLADIAAKRRLLALAEDEDRYPCTECSGSGFTIVHALASVYADHPDFNQEWRL